MSPGNRGRWGTADLAIQAGSTAFQHLHVFQQPGEERRQRRPDRQPGTTGQFICEEVGNTGSKKAVEAQTPNLIGQVQPWELKLSPAKAQHGG